MIYLVEFEAYDRAKASVVTERFATDGYTTRPTDAPANVHWEERVINPGSFQQSVFGDGTTSGEAQVGFGFVEIAIGDDGAGFDCDRLASHAVDGRPIRIWSLESARAPWASRTLIFSGVMEQIEVDWTTATIRIRDRLEDLRIAVQPTLYAGTTTDGTKLEAEGGKDDLKDAPKPLAFGVCRNVPGTLSNRFKLIYDFAANGVTEFRAVRDRGVTLAAGADYPTLTALLSASVAPATYASCRAKGHIRLGSEARGAVTADLAESAAGQRSAAKVAQRILERAGFVAGVGFSSVDLDALHGIQPAEVEIYVGTNETQVLDVVTRVLDSIGAFVAPDTLGVLRFGRIDAPFGSGPIIDQFITLDGNQKIGRIATGDDRKGVPASKVTVQYGRSWLVQSEDELAGGASADVRAFVTNEYRSSAASSAAVSAIHLKPAELTFQTLLANEADAAAEAARRLALYGARRERYRVPLHASQAQGIRLGQIVTLRLPRFGLDAGKPMLVIGLDATLPARQGDTTSAGIVILDLYG